ncbi:MAG: isoprenyl transferase [Erysipelotrichaceae bacterium]|nr:isoprenyl transferase [Erysipelotrichaceae bacterium]
MDSSVKHVAIIMDGNGRWAKEQGKPRTYGHFKGTENVRNIAIKANKMGIKVLTLYAFSTENWKRPQQEVDYLMSLPEVFIDRYLQELMDNDIRIATIGDISAFPEKTRRVLQRAIDTTANNKSMTLVLAMNYGGRADIIRAVNRYISDNSSKAEIPPVDEETFEKYLYTADYPEIDLMIRTSLDYRLSNFLLWQLSYSELYFTDIHWPDFNEEEFEKAINEFYKRSRRFGGLG